MPPSKTPLVLLVLLGSALVPHASVSAVSCLDESGESVDYFSMMKYNNAAEYDYLDASSTSYKPSSNSLESTTEGALALTLDQVYSGHSSLNYAMWNDEDSSGSTHGSRAHSKGVIAYDEDGGFWLTHSVPRYPNTVSEGKADLPDYKYGQSFLCLTLSASKFETVAKQMQIVFPYVYDSALNYDDSGSFADFVNGIADKDTQLSTETITTAGRRSFTHYAKNKDNDVDIYEVIAADLKKPIYAETWMNGETSNQMPSYCDGSYTVEDVTVVQSSSTDTTWKETQDHSKWLVTKSTSSGTGCIGDLNRQYSQSSRGGGMLCYSTSSFVEALNDRVDEYSSCSSGQMANATQPMLRGAGV